MEEGSYPVTAACSRFEGELESFLEGEARPFVLSHARLCPSCGALLADLQAIRAAARALPDPEPTPFLWTRLRTRLDAERAAARAACAQFDSELEAFMEGEARPFVASHARECAACGALLADLQSLRTAAQELPPVEPAPSLWSKIRARLEAEGAFHLAACSQFDSELGAFLEGDARPFVASHAETCAACGTMLADLRAIQEASANLPLEAPPDNLWLQVRAKLAEEGAFRKEAEAGQFVAFWRQFLSLPTSRHLVPVGALAGLVFLATALTLPSPGLRRGANPERAASSYSSFQLASATPPSEDLAIAQVVSSLETSFKANESSMTPDLKAAYEKSLVSLDGSIRECLDSLHQEPGNTLAHDYLLAAYSRKAEVLSSALEFQGR